MNNSRISHNRFSAVYHTTRLLTYTESPPEATDKADQAPRHRPLISPCSVRLPRVFFQRLVFSLPRFVFLTAMLFIKPPFVPKFLKQLG
ncbi:hypothetical protein VNO80_10981 [Phaseolus coccineus]|uniref:Uncharacterized protein n=1 Tax=Phaseolus coccineus TaxID=3886 RepID=A0AAN9NFI7_PHACN